MIVLSDDKALLQVDRIHGWLASSYWKPGVARDRIERAIAGSHCLGAYEGGAQVGFARVITDYTTLGWIADVWVDGPARGQGLGRRMVQWFLDHPEFATVRRFLLVTADAHGVYRANGFDTPLRPERYMERLSHELARQIRRT